MLLHGLIQYALKTANELPYSIKRSNNGWSVWHHMGGGSWIITATFAKRLDAEDFVVSKSEVI